MIRIGIDLDNTLIDFTRLFRLAARTAGAGHVFTPDRPRRAARDLLRQEPGGEDRWQAMQARVYGPLIIDADLFPGAKETLLAWRDAGIDLCILSHKSEYAAADPEGINLRDAADAFLKKQGLDFIPARYFPTREAKIEAIWHFDPAWFIDDLPEVLDDPFFPTTASRILFAPDGMDYPGHVIARNWDEVSNIVHT